MKKTIHLPTLFMVLFIVSCSQDDDIIPSSGYERTVIPAAIEDMYVGKGSVAQDTVIVYAEGGPEPTLLATDIERPAFNDFYRVYVKQAQQINETIPQNEISFEDAIAEDQISTEMYQSVLEHFVNEGKVVIGMSHSFGSFILANVLATNPNVADKYIIMAGRLDMPEVVWQGFRDGNLYTFTNNGTAPIADGGAPETGGFLSASRLQAGLGMNRFTELLANKNLANLAYIYGEYDEAVGRLSNEEVQFLENKNALVLKVEEGDHSVMFQQEGLDFIVNQLIRN